MSKLKLKVKRIVHIMSPYKWGISVLVPILLGVSLFLLKELNYLYMQGFSSFFAIDVNLKARMSLLYVFYIFCVISLIFIQCFFCVYSLGNQDNSKIEHIKNKKDHIIDLLITNYTILCSLNVIIIYICLQLSFSLSPTLAVNRSHSVYAQTVVVFLLILSQIMIHNDKFVKRVLKLSLPYLSVALLIIITEGSNFVAMTDAFIFITVVSVLILAMVIFMVWLSKNIKDSKRVIFKFQDSLRVNEMILMTTAVLFILIIGSITLLTGFIKEEGYRAAKSMTDVLLVKVNEIQYIAFDQLDHIIALEIKSDDGYYLKKGEYSILEKKNLKYESFKIEFIQTIFEDKIDLIFK